ncbi:Protein LiaF [Lentibacillus sp. JNUCC-1]|uniref:cell wall-active antibiotics response protein LiaF n=1 Tax=Lentibacillus sp. JNUCC-1 TaxID=2654513 RepID=UPI0012E70AA4|nr:Protein LiaF [Lentibacillus sp. JNUCC-1]
MRGRFLTNLVAITLITFGVLLVLANVGVIQFDFKTIWHHFYPVLFVVFGLKWLINGLRNKGGSWIFGSLFLLVGILLLLDRFDVIAFGFEDMLKLWPLLIIYIGFSMIGWPWKKKGRTFVYTENGEKKVFHRHRKSSRFSIGDHSFNEENWTLTPIDYRDAVGDYYINIAKAFIPEEEIPIRINNWAGEIQILLPKDVPCRVDASVKAGELIVFGEALDGINRSLFFESPDYADATRKLGMHLRMKAGSIRVDRV